MSAPRRARVRAFAKINLDLQVLERRPDNYHEIRTIFQTISLADTLDISFTPARKPVVRVTSNIQIADNLVEGAAHLMEPKGLVEIHVEKRIPLGAGLGGGSSDAAAILLALPVLAGRRLDFPALLRAASELGSDVPFFLLGGRAVGIGRGTEVYPLPDLPAQLGLVVTSSSAVSTRAAYGALTSPGNSSSLTSEDKQNKIFSFEQQAWNESSGGENRNFFEELVFSQLPQLAGYKRRLLKLGAEPAMMTGSGSAIFGLFGTRAEVRRAVESFREEQVFPISLVSRARYQSMWRQWLRPHLKNNLWPPQSRYAR